jgi:hypothetical protein
MGLNPIGNPNWASDTTATIERIVSAVRDRTTKPAITVVRGVVFGMLAAVLACFAGVLFVIVALRLLQVLLAWPFDHDTAVWASYLVAGGIFSIAGWFILTRRHHSGDEL